MKRFLIKISSSGLLLFSILFLIKSSLPFYWGNDEMRQKIPKILDDEANYDCLFFGSSKTMRHIDPVLFDSITGYQSYNMGGSAIFFLETHYLLEHFLEKNPDENLKIFLQRTTPKSIDTKNFHTTRSKYCMDFKRMKMGVAYYWKLGEYKQVYRHFISFLENKLCIGELRAIKRYHDKRLIKLPKSVMNEQRGFYSTTQRFALKKSKYMRRVRKEYENSKQFKENLPISEDKKKVSIERLLPKKINLDTPQKTIELFKIHPIKLEVKYNFDRGHFNIEGAEIFTRKVGEFVNQEGF